MKVIFVTPIFNEERNIPELIRRISDVMKSLGDYLILFVNDGSTDQSERVISEYQQTHPIELVGYYPNRGVGSAFKLGFKTAISRGKEGDIVVTQEGDNTSDLGILPKLLDHVRRGTDVALASCYAKGGRVEGTTWLRTLLSHMANFLLRTIFPIRVHTYSSFYRAYRLTTLKRLIHTYGDQFIAQPGFECMVELLVKLSRLPNVKISEVPMVLDGSRRQGKSKMKVLKTMRGFLRVMISEGVYYRLAPAVKVFTKS